MMRAAILLAGAVAVGGVGAGILYVGAKRREEEEAAARGIGAGGMTAKPPEDAARAAREARSGKGMDFADIRSAVSAGALSPAGTVGAGLTLVTTLGTVARAVGGEGAGDVAGSGIGGLGLASGVIIGKLGERVGQAVGLSRPAAQTVGLLTGAGVVVGAPGVLAAGTAKAVGEGTSWLVGKVFGSRTESAARGVAREFDPFRSGSLANKPVRAVAGGVRKVGKFIGSIF